MLMKSSQNPVLVIDLEEKATYINPAFEKTFGWNEQDVRQSGLGLWSDQQLIPITSELARLENGNQIISMEARLNKKSGLPVDLYISTAPLLDDKKRIVLLSDESNKKPHLLNGAIL